MKTPLVQIVVLTVFALHSSHVLSLSFDGSRGELSNLAILGPGLLILSSFQGAFGEKSKRSKKKQDPEEVKDEDEKAKETSKTVANHIIEELKEKAKKIQAQNLQNKTPQDDIPKKKVSPQNDVEMNPMKCFPKALCGVSSEVAQISKKQKNGLITDYLLLMRAIARNPDVVDEAARPLRNKKKNNNDDEPQDDIEQNDEGSSEEAEEDEDEEDDEDSREGEEEDEEENAQDDEDSYKGKKSSKKSKEPLSPDDKLHEEYLREKLEMDQLYKETVDKETWNDDNWWGAYGDDSPTVNKNKRRPPNYRTDIPDGGTSGNAGGASSFLSNLFSFGSPGNRGSGSSFEGMARDFPSAEIVPGIGMDETKEILETAIEIGKGFDRPSQCNEIFNGCKYDYTDLLYMIDEMRHSLREKSSKNGKRKGNKKAKTAVEVNHQQQSSSSVESFTGSKTKSKSRYRVTPKGSRKKNKQIKKKRPNKSDTDRVVIPNSHEKLTKLSPHHHQNHHNPNHYSGDESAGPPGSSPGFSLSNMFSSWLG